MEILSNSTTATIDLEVGNDTMSTTSTNSDHSKFIFQVLVVVIGIVGMSANGFVAIIFQMTKDIKTKKINLLMLNQLILDMYSCGMLAAVYGTKLAGFFLTSTWGTILCKLFVNEMPIWIGKSGSTANLVVIAVERYLMIVHPIWHKNHVRAWMIRAVVAFTWFNGVVLNMPLLSIASIVQDGQCVASLMSWKPLETFLYSFLSFLFSYVMVLVAFIYCYGRILTVVVRQAKTFTSQSTTGTVGTTAAQVNAHRTKLNVVKTMITITALFIFCWLPNYMYITISINNPNVLNVDVYEATLLLGFFNISMNPFIYAGQHESIRLRLNEMGAYCGGLAGRAIGRLLTHSSAVHPSSLPPTIPISHLDGVTMAVRHGVVAEANVPPIVDIDI